jgi:hypothetical protein
VLHIGFKVQLFLGLCYFKEDIWPARVFRGSSLEAGNLSQIFQQTTSCPINSLNGFLMGFTELSLHSPYDEIFPRRIIILSQNGPPIKLTNHFCSDFSCTRFGRGIGSLIVWSEAGQDTTMVREWDTYAKPVIYGIVVHLESR